MSVVSKMIIFPERINKSANKNKQKYFFFIFRARQGFDLALTYFHQRWKIRV